MFGITFETWEAVCNMYFGMKESWKKSYLQWFPFSKLTQEDEEFIIARDFFDQYIDSGAFVMFTNLMQQTKNYMQKSDGSFRDASLISPILFLVVQSIGKEISKNYYMQRPDEVQVFYAGNLDYMSPLYKQDYDAFYKAINSEIEYYQYYIKTDISNFYKSINLDKLIHQIDCGCNSNGSVFSQHTLSLYRNLISFCGDGGYPIIENSVASSYLATVVYLDTIDRRLYDYIKSKLTVLKNFRIIRYVDDMYIFITTDKPIGFLYEAYNNIRSEYSSLLMEYNLTLNSQKCGFSPTHEINNDLKQSLYDEYINGIRYELAEMFRGKLKSFIDDLSAELLIDYVSVDKYNAMIKKHFFREDVECSPNEVLNHFLYNNDKELQSGEIVSSITTLIDCDISFIFLDPKRLTVMIMKTQNTKAIKAFLNQLFERYRKSLWNSHDTTVAINYLIQSKFRHVDLLGIIKTICPPLFCYCQCCCCVSFACSWIDKFTDNLCETVHHDQKTFFLYFSYLVEIQRSDYLSAFAYFKNYFDRVTAILAFEAQHEPRFRHPNFKRYYKEGDIKAFYSCIANSDAIIEQAHVLRNANPISHASAGLIEHEGTFQELLDSIQALKKLVYERFLLLRNP